MGENAMLKQLTKVVIEAALRFPYQLVFTAPNRMDAALVIFHPLNATSSHLPLA